MAKAFDELPWEERRVVLKRLYLEQAVTALELDKETITAIYDTLPEKPIYRKETGEIDVAVVIDEPIDPTPK